MDMLAYWQGIPKDKPIIHFYAIFILVGALLALFLSSYRAHKKGFDWSFFLTIFVVAFPCGIIGARIWYVIASWSEFANDPVSIFYIWKGGLAIQGGAIGGVLAGALVAFFRRKGTPLLQCTDFAVPTIIVAQAIGRWGNFFNQEVFGQAVLEDAWSFLPGFITNNMQNGGLPMLGGNGVTIPEGMIAAPLFLVEGVINIAFYFLMTTGLEAVEGKHYKNGDSTFAYFISYGIIRVILEPLRNAYFIMGGSEDPHSQAMAIAFIVLGVFLIFMNHLLRYLDNRKHLFDNVPFLHKAILYLKERAGDIQEVSVSSASASLDGLDMDRIKELSRKKDEEEK